MSCKVNGVKWPKFILRYLNLEGAMKNYKTDTENAETGRLYTSYWLMKHFLVLYQFDRVFTAGILFLCTYDNHQCIVVPVCNYSVQ
jgi:hypothetical protein